MKIVQTEISLQFNNAVSVIERNDLYFTSPFHFHPEIELVYIVDGSGKRIIGDKLDNFTRGEVVLIGANLPHVWISNEIEEEDSPGMKARSIAAYFKREIFGNAFYELKEAENINRLLDAASRGVKIVRSKQDEISCKLKELVDKSGFERIILLLHILHSIASDPDSIEYINDKTYSGCAQKTESDRLAQVFKYVNNNFKKNIRLKDVAEIANLTPQSFCRFFKNRQRKNFIEYLHEVRISHACRYLMQTDQTIAEIAYNTGFKTVSNFNRLFKQRTGFCPSDYRYHTTANI